jgi:vitamin B12 transporter
MLKSLLINCRKLNQFRTTILLLQQFNVMRIKVEPAYRNKYYCFRYWSRKKISVLRSLALVIKIGVLCLSYSILKTTPVLNAQTDSIITELKLREIEEVEVIGRRNQAVFSEVSRFITVVRHAEIEKTGTQHIQDFLEYISNADVRQRGAEGIQADISLRGGSFDHVMVLVNGMNMSDPQTGHLSLDLPFGMESVDRIEVLEGSAARILGPGAFTGAVNILTNSGGSNNLSASLTYGKYNYRRAYLTMEFLKGSLRSFFSLNRSISDGYIQNTDFKNQNIYYHGNLLAGKTSIDFQSGYMHKHFGAGGFYSPRFPDQYEKSDLWMSSVRVSTGLKNKLTSAISWRRRKDHFMLDRDDPAFYQNYHLTDVFGSQLNFIFGHKILTSALGFDVRSEHILSNNIGFDYPDPVRVRGENNTYYTKKYDRTNIAYFQEHNLAINRLNVTGGLMINWNTGYPDKPFLSPGIDIGYQLFNRGNIFLSVNRAFHLPTFTDMFYKDPLNQGNITLQPNRMVSFEGGIKYQNEVVNGSISVFYNSGRDIIDWLWTFDQNIFRPVNLQEYKAQGLASHMVYVSNKNTFICRLFSQISINYQFINIKKSLTDSVSKYYNLRQKLSAGITQNITDNLVCSWYVSYQDRYGELIGYRESDKMYYSSPYKPFWLIDGTIKWKIRFIELFAEMSNILNKHYVDAGSVIQPGRWLKAGLILRLEAKEKVPEADE